MSGWFTSAICSEALSELDADHQLESMEDGAIASYISGVPRIAVLGSTSSGKTTLLNTLLGDSILPTSIDHNTCFPLHVVPRRIEPFCPTEGSETSAYSAYELFTFTVLSVKVETPAGSHDGSVAVVGLLKRGKSAIQEKLRHLNTVMITRRCHLATVENTLEGCSDDEKESFYSSLCVFSDDDVQFKRPLPFTLNRTKQKDDHRLTGEDACIHLDAYLSSSSSIILSLRGQSECSRLLSFPCEFIDCAGVLTGEHEAAGLNETKTTTNQRKLLLEVFSTSDVVLYTASAEELRNGLQQDVLDMQAIAAAQRSFINDKSNIQSSCVLLPTITKADESEDAETLFRAVELFQREIARVTTNYRTLSESVKKRLGLLCKTLSPTSRASSEAKERTVLISSAHLWRIFDSAIVIQSRLCSQVLRGQSISNYADLVLEPLREAEAIADHSSHGIYFRLKRKACISNPNTLRDCIQKAVKEEVTNRCEQLSVELAEQCDNPMDTTLMSVIASNMKTFQKALDRENRIVATTDRICSSLREALLSNLTWAALVTKTRSVFIHTRLAPKDFASLSQQEAETTTMFEEKLLAEVVCRPALMQDQRKKAKAVKIGTLVGAGAVTLIGAVLVPGIGALVGGSLFGLSGAAATSAGLAALGGGAIAAGGLGMAGGTAVVLIFMGALGAAASFSIGTAVNKYLAVIQRQQKRLECAMKYLRKAPTPKVTSDKFIDCTHVKFKNAPIESFRSEVLNKVKRQDKSFKFVGYIGEFVGKQPNGRGCLLSPVGLPFFEGEFVAGVPHGRGRFYVPVWQETEGKDPAEIEGCYAEVISKLFEGDFDVVCEAKFYEGKLLSFEVAEGAEDELLKRLTSMELPYHIINRMMVEKAAPTQA